MARTIAAAGYYVLVPNLFYRHGRAPVLPIPDLTRAEQREPFFAKIAPLLDELTPDRSARDATAYLEFLTTRPEVRPGPIAIIGYCMGSALAITTAAAHSDQVAAVACFHPGPLVADAPDSPHLLAARTGAELYVGLADNDPASMPPEAVAELRRTLDHAAARYTAEVYPGTVHGFTMADTAAFDPAGLRKHWDRLIPLLQRNLNSRG
ncbi:dienelactone hydrolase family protein [Nocardia crassostreae]|uniref:dienelactone hydrolase family protein n=1 Tax=Nocardia crassostreae TaxID=53428 RepID=UPI0008338DFA|nr:dienelactone hydrolase family protein [Nocardia crassostreae]